MAEATERPADAAAPADAVQPAAPDAAAAGAAEAPAAEAEAPAKPYSTVSLTAVVGFAVAALYALVVGVAALVALFTKTPLLLPLAAFFVPLGAIVISFAARIQIRGSEGALSGLRLTAWGIGLSLFVALIYTAYYSAIYLAVTWEARRAADEWFAHVGNADEEFHLEKAFRVTLPPDLRPRDDANLRTRLELDHNHPSGRHDSLTEFRQDLIVRLIQQGGNQTHWEYSGVKEWKYETDGFHVTLTYRLTTPFTANDVEISFVGSEGRDDPRRQWRMVGCQAAAGWEDKQVTDEGRRMAGLKVAAADFAARWVAKEFSHRHKYEAYADTLPPAKRAELADGLRPLVASIGLAVGAAGIEAEAATPVRVIELARDRSAREALAEKNAACKELLAGLPNYEAGALVRADSPGFWAPDGKVGDKPVREDMVVKVKQMFEAGGWPEQPEAFMPDFKNLPIYNRDQSGERLGFDLKVGTLVTAEMKNPQTGQVRKMDVPEYAFEGRLVVENTAPGAQPADAQWRIHSVELVSGRTGDRSGDSPRQNLQAGRPPVPPDQPK
jgi:hypothetical protein